MERIGPRLVNSDLPEWEQKMWTRKSTAESHSADWRDQHGVYWRTYYGQPWNSADVSWFRKTDRPLVNFNYFVSTVGAVLGQEMLNRREVRFEGVGSELEDQAVAAWMTQGARTQLVKSNFGETCDGVYTDQCISGWGFAHAYVDTSRFPFRIKVELVDPSEIYWDPYAQSPTLRDARYIVRERRWNMQDAIARWPDKEAKLRTLGSAATTSQQGFFQRSWNSARRWVGRDMTPPREDNVAIWEYQYREPVPYVSFEIPERIDPSSGQPLPPLMPGYEPGTRVEVERDLFSEIEQQWREDPTITGDVEVLRYPRDVYMRAVVAAPDSAGSGVTLEKPTQMSIDHYSYAACGGFSYRDSESGTIKRFGFGHLIYEPQLWSSRIISAQIEMISRGAKGGGFFEENVFSDPEAFMRDSAKPGAWHMVRPGGLERMRERNAMPWPSGGDMLLNMARTALPEVTGVSAFLKGISTQERSSLFVSNQQQQQLVALAPIYAPQEEFRVDVARIVGRLMYLYTPHDDLDRMLGEHGRVEGLTYELTQDPATGEEIEVPVVDEMTGQPLTAASYIKDRANPLDWDVVADTGVATKTELQQIWINFQSGLLEQLSNLAPQEMRLMLPEVLRSMPVSGDMPKRWGDKLEELMAQQEQAQKVEGILGLLEKDPQMKQQILQVLVQEAMAQRQQQPQQQPMPQQGTAV